MDFFQNNIFLGAQKKKPAGVREDLTEPDKPKKSAISSLLASDPGMSTKDKIYHHQSMLC